MDKFPIYNLVIDDEDDGIYAVSLVHDPAVERNFIAMASNKDIHRFSVTNNDMHLVTGVVMLPDTPIYRNDIIRGEHYVVFSADTIRKLIYKFFKNGCTSSVNLEHWNYCDNVYLVESYIKDSVRNISPVEFSDVPDGSWIATYRVANLDVWDSLKEGKFRGFSIEGYLSYDDEYKNNLLDEMINNFLKDEC